MKATARLDSNIHSGVGISLTALILHDQLPEYNAYSGKRKSPGAVQVVFCDSKQV